MACSNSSDNYSGRNCPHYRKEKEMKEKDLILTSIILFILVLILTIVIVKPKQKTFQAYSTDYVQKGTYEATLYDPRYGTGANIINNEEFKLKIVAIEQYKDTDGYIVTYKANVRIVDMIVFGKVGYNYLVDGVLQ